MQVESGREAQVREGADWLEKRLKDRMVNEGDVVQGWRESRPRKNSGNMSDFLIRDMTGVEGKIRMVRSKRRPERRRHKTQKTFRHTMTLK